MIKSSLLVQIIIKSSDKSADFVSNFVFQKLTWLLETLHTIRNNTSFSAVPF